MESTPAIEPSRWGAIFWAIIAGGLAAGLGDLIFAIVHYQQAPVLRILQAIAAGLLGRETAHQGGLATAALGVLLHFSIATGAAAVFVAASRRWAWLIRFPGPAGLGYGAVVYFAMNFVVVPLSRVGSGAYPPKVDWTSVVGHMVLVGLPIALAAHWSLRRRAPA